MSAVGFGSESRSKGCRPRRWRRGVRRLIGLVAVGFVAGAVGGFLTGGIGSRLAMRLVALIAGNGHAGELTEAQAVVGEVTLEGTLFLLLLGTVVGIVGGLFYLVVRRWMPGTGFAKGVWYGVFLLAVFGCVVVDGDNVDFRLFVSSYLSVALFASLFVVYGAIVAPIVERFDRDGGAIPARGDLALAGYVFLGFASLVGVVQDVRSLLQIF